ncbi:MAG: oligosaccharide flippase family protein, partial [Oceanospirillaceae bacterium]
MNAIKSISWILFDKVFLIILSTISFYVFALYLSPSELGKGAIFIAVSSLAAGMFSGMIEAPLVSKAQIDKGEYASVFWFSLFLSTSVFILILTVGWFIIEDSKDYILLIFSASTVMFILTSRIYLADLRRRRKFKSIALRSFLGKSIAFVGGVWLAVNEFGSVSMVTQFMLQELIGLIIMAYYTKGIIKFTFNTKLIANTLNM